MKVIIDMCVCMCVYTHTDMYAHAHMHACTFCLTHIDTQNYPASILRLSLVREGPMSTLVQP